MARPSTRAAFTLLELLIAILALGIGIVSISTVLYSGARLQKQAFDQVNANALATNAQRTIKGAGLRTTDLDQHITATVGSSNGHLTRFEWTSTNSSGAPFSVRDRAYQPLKNKRRPPITHSPWQTQATLGWEAFLRKPSTGGNVFEVFAFILKTDPTTNTFKINEANTTDTGDPYVLQLSANAGEFATETGTISNAKDTLELKSMDYIDAAARTPPGTELILEIQASAGNTSQVYPWHITVTGGSVNKLMFTPPIPQGYDAQKMFIGAYRHITNASPTRRVTSFTLTGLTSSP